MNRLAGLVALVALLSACVVPPVRGSSDYRAMARSTLEATSSEVATATLVVDLLQHDRITKAYADETVSADEDALGSIATTFLSRQPPRSQDALRADVSDVLEAAQDAVAAARIATRRSDAAQLQQAADQLADATEQLDHATESLS